MSKIVSIELQLIEDDVDQYLIKLDNDDNVIIGITNTQWCCEQFGIKITPNHNSFIGATINKIRWAWGREEKQYSGDYEGSATVVVITDKGDLTITAWNNHNGYYKHDIRVKWSKTDLYDGCCETQTL